MANPRFFGKKDLDTFDRVNKELIGDLNNANSGIIDQTVIVYKISASNTETNMYGETSNGKVFKPGVEIACLVEAEDMAFNTDEFGPDLNSNISMFFQILNHSMSITNNSSHRFFKLTNLVKRAYKFYTS